MVARINVSPSFYLQDIILICAHYLLKSLNISSCIILEHSRTCNYYISSSFKH